MTAKFDLSEVKIKTAFPYPELPEASFFPYRIDMGGYYICGNSYYTYRDSFIYSIILFTKAGCGEIIYRDSHILLPPGHMVLLDGKYAHRYAAWGEEKWELMWIHYTDKSPCSFSDFLYGKGIFLQRVAEKDFLDFFERIRANARHSSALDAMRTSQSLSDFLCEWAQTNYTETFPTIRSKDQIVNKVQSYMQKHYETEITLDYLAKECAVSKFYIIRLFRDLLGMTPHQYLLNVRIGQAKLFLMSTAETVSDIGEKVGFSNCSSFIAAFKKITGTTPMNFRKTSK